MKKLLILSGKGGTGKTTTAAAFIAFSKTKAMADCDVDAPNLHLVMNAGITPESTDFIGASKAFIDPVKCSNCGLCAKNCRFDAIRKTNDGFQIQDYACEGCGVCEYVCKEQAIIMQPDVAGRLDLYKSDIVFSTAELKMGRGNSGKLVAGVKNQLFKENLDTQVAIIDGSPGIGCPVMASVTGMDMVLIVTEPTVSGLSDLKRLVELISMLQVKIMVCVNKCDVNPAQTEKIKNFCEREKIIFAGEIPYDKNASRAINKGISLADIDCDATDALKVIYRKVMDTLLKLK